MDEKRLMMMVVASNILASYYGNKVSYCIVNKREPDRGEKDNLLRSVISMFENLSTTYIKDIENIAKGGE